MVYFAKWEDFTNAVHELHSQSLDKMRFCIRFRQSTGHLFLKATDDHKCYKFKTNRAVYLNRFELLTHSLTSTMQNKPKLPAVPESSAPAIKDSADVDMADATASAPSTPAKKKKGKKRK